MNRGIYFSANDAVLPWVIAFLNSVRHSNPGLPVFLIPFNDNCQRVMELRFDYDFQIFEDPGFVELEALGARYELGFTPHGKYWFRRYAAFWGPLDQFAYFDARQLILNDLTAAFEVLEQTDLELIHFDTAINQVYQPGQHRELLVCQGRGTGFNSGRWFAKRGVFCLSDFTRLGDESLLIRDQLNPRNTDQAFINYCCDHQPVRTAHIADLLGDVCRSGWARQAGEIYQDHEGVYRLWDHGGLDHQKKLLLVHWAGIPLGAIMPRRKLFRTFATQSASLGAGWVVRVTDVLGWPFLAGFAALRRNRIVSQWYRKIRKP